MAYGMMKQLKLSPDSAIKAFGVSGANLEGRSVQVKAPPEIIFGRGF
jgi:hypothetical protein